MQKLSNDTLERLRESYLRGFELCVLLKHERAANGIESEELGYHDFLMLQEMGDYELEEVKVRFKEKYLKEIFREDTMVEDRRKKESEERVKKMSEKIS